MIMTEKVSDKPKISSRGGARPGSGRPRGSGNKVTALELLEAVHAATGRSFVECLADGYRQAVEERNNKIRVMYEKMIVDKVIADRQQIEISDPQEQVAARQAAFAAALACIQESQLNTK